MTLFAFWDSSDNKVEHLDAVLLDIQESNQMMRNYTRFNGRAAVCASLQQEFFDVHGSGVAACGTNGQAHVHKEAVHFLRFYEVDSSNLPTLPEVLEEVVWPFASFRGRGVCNEVAGTSTVHGLRACHLLHLYSMVSSLGLHHLKTLVAINNSFNGLPCVVAG